MTDPSTPGGSPPTTPYVGLVPFREEDADFFFGRRKEIRIVTGNLRASRLTIVYGASGVGKTSLLQAGVVRALRRSVLERPKGRSERAPFAICVFRDWRGDPVPALLDTIRGSVVEAAGIDSVRAWEPGEPPADALRAWTKDVRTLLVVLDQFEDYFLYHPDEDGPGTFARELPAIVNEPNLRVNFLLSLREDAWAKLDRFKGRIPRLFSNYLRVEHLSRTAAREAIEGPISEWNRRLPPDEEPYALEPALVDAVIAAAAGYEFAPAQSEAVAAPEPTSRDAVEAPFLQLVMERVWRAAVEAGSRELTISRLEELGGARRIFEDHVVGALGTLVPDERAIAADVFRFLVTSSKTKIARPASDLAEWTGRPEPELTSVLDKLCEGESGRILRRIPPPAGTSGASSYELYHDVLADPIGEWRRDYEQDRARRAALRRLVRVGGTLAVLVAIFASLAAWALVQRSEAQRATRAATSLALASTASDELARRPDVASLLALEAYRANPSPQAADSMIEALAATRRTGTTAILRGDPTVDPKGVRAIAFSTDGRTLASAAFDGTLRLWDVQERRPLGDPLRGHTDEVWGLSFSPDGTTLASASDDGTVRLWDVTAGRQIGDPLSPQIGALATVAFSPDGETLAFAGRDGDIHLWSVRERRPLGPPLDGHENGVVTVAWSPDGRHLASASRDGTARLWDLEAGSSTPLTRHDGPVLSVAFSSDGRVLASSDEDGRVWVWRVPSGKPLAGPIDVGSRAAWGVALSPDGRTVAFSGFDGTVRLWDLRANKPLGQPLRGHTKGVVAVAFSPDGGTLASAGYDGTVRLWAMPPAAFLGTPLTGHDGAVKGVAFSPDGRTLASAGDDGTVRLWDALTGKPLGQLGADGTDSVEDIAFRPDGLTLAVAGNDGPISIWDVQEERLLGELVGHAGKVENVAFGPDGRLLVSAGADGTVRLWDVRELEQIGDPLVEDADQLRSVAFSPDGHTLATADSSGLRLWDARTGQPVGSLPLPSEDAPQTVAFSPDGEELVSGSIGQGGVVQLWDVRRRTPLTEPRPAHEDTVESVAFSPDGRTVASAGNDDTVRLWDADGLRALGPPLVAGSGGVYDVGFSPDGRTLASGEDGTARLWQGILWTDLDDLREMVCRLVVGNLTESEWRALAPGLSYRTTCPG